MKEKRQGNKNEKGRKNKEIRVEEKKWSRKSK